MDIILASWQCHLPKPRIKQTKNVHNTPKKEWKAKVDRERKRTKRTRIKCKNYDTGQWMMVVFVLADENNVFLHL